MTSRRAPCGRSAAALVVVALLGGCLPEYLSETSDICGSVLDAASGASIAGATLRYPDFPATTVTTRSDGSFTFPAIRRWSVVMLYGDRNPAIWLDISASGYKAERLTMYFGEQGSYTFRLEREIGDSASDVGAGRSSGARGAHTSGASAVLDSASPAPSNTRLQRTGPAQAALPDSACASVAEAEH